MPAADESFVWRRLSTESAGVGEKRLWLTGLLSTYGGRAFRLLVRRFGTRYLINSEIRRVVSRFIYFTYCLIIYKKATDYGIASQTVAQHIGLLS